MKKILIYLTLLIIPALSFATSIEGFKDIKFGMNMSQLQDLGFACDVSKNTCVSHDFSSGNSYAKRNLTIFDKKVKSVHVALNAKGEANTITVVIGINDAIAVQDSIIATFGSPKKVSGIDMDKNKGMTNSISTSYWSIGNVDLSTMTVFGGTMRTSAVIFKNLSLTDAKDAPKPSKDF